MVFSSIRFLARGWVDSLYLAPEYHLTYPGFGWVHPWPAPWMHLHVVALAALGACIALGWRTRIAAVLFTVGFAYTELIDAALYLNHYWYMTLVGVLTALLPVGNRWSLDARAGRVTPSPTVQAAVVWTLRGQLAVVYAFAGLAKLNGDWLWRAQPLRLWLPDRSDLPVVGELLDEPAMAYLASWSSAVFDCTIVMWLLWRRSRPWAFVVLACFHAITGWLFPAIGVFPWVMTAGALIFFHPEWPSRLKAALIPTAKPSHDPPDTSTTATATLLPLTPQATATTATATTPQTTTTTTSATTPQTTTTTTTPQTTTTTTSATTPQTTTTTATATTPQTTTTTATTPQLASATVVVLMLLAVAQVLLPLRHYAYPGDVRWTEEGYYLSWRVMLTEKTGYAQFHVTDSDTGRSWLTGPELVLTDWQAAQAVIRPALLRSTTRLVADHYRKAGIVYPQVQVDSWVSFNGRPAQRLVDFSSSLHLCPLVGFWHLAGC